MMPGSSRFFRIELIGNNIGPKVRLMPLGESGKNWGWGGATEVFHLATNEWEAEALTDPN